MWGGKMYINYFCLLYINFTFALSLYQKDLSFLLVLFGFDEKMKNL